MKRRKHVGCGLLAVGVLLPIAYCAGVLNCVIEPFWFRKVIIYEDLDKLYILYSTEFDDTVSEMWAVGAEEAKYAPERFLQNPTPISLADLRARWGLHDRPKRFQSQLGSALVEPMAHGYRVSGIYEDPRSVTIRFSTFVSN